MLKILFTNFFFLIFLCYVINICIIREIFICYTKKYVKLNAFNINSVNIRI